MIRWNPSLRTELILLLGALVLVARASLSSIAYSTSRAIIERGAMRESESPPMRAAGSK